MATFNKIADFVEDLMNGVHNFDTHTFRLALSNTAPGSETPNPTTAGNGILANVTQIAYTNLAGGVAPALDNMSVTLATATATIDCDDEAITASGGSVGPFRYVYIYNDTAASDPLVGYYDYGSSITLADGETLNFRPAAGGIATLT